ncbi:MAG: 4-hydroxythreonine-4-phosphate dehydrogenase PdxA [Chthoniobacterales bacterium]
MNSAENERQASLPVIAITMGDPAGIGPEVIAKALAHKEVYEKCLPLVVGDVKRMETAVRITKSALAVEPIKNPAELKADRTKLYCLGVTALSPDLPFGKLAAEGGEAAYQYVKKAAELAMAREIDAICTAPLNKEAMHAAGHKFPGHTELLASLTHTPEVSMLLVTPKLRVVHVTTHIGLLDAVAKIEPGLVERTIRRGNTAMREAGIKQPRIGVCGINPHAGENGLFGRGEEEKKIAPAVAACRHDGIDVEGPLPADTLFYRAIRGDFDLVVAMFHDQGHGPIKVLGIETGVNVTLGLPVVRTSVDHGTAFDIAGTGRADERSMMEALFQAANLAKARKGLPESGIQKD